MFMVTIKNPKRVKSNANFIENYTKTAISTEPTVVSVDLEHSSNMTLSESKMKIRQFLSKMRVDFSNSEYLLLTSLEGGNPSHKMLLSLKGESISQFERLLGAVWPTKKKFEILDRKDAGKWSRSFKDFYEASADGLQFTNENNSKTKSKIFQRSRKKECRDSAN